MLNLIINPKLKLLKISFIYNQQVKFTNSGDIIYAVALEQETDDGENYESAFKTFDASDYSSIGKHLKNCIRDYVPKTITC